MLQIHITEEARHVRFAELMLAERLPRLGVVRRRFLRWAVPVVLRDAQRMMLTPAPRLRARYAIPTAVMRECYGPGSTHRAEVERIAAPVLALLGAEGAGSRVFS